MREGNSARAKALAPLFLMMLLALPGPAALSGCRPKPEPKPLWERPSAADLPAEVAAWVANSRSLFAKQTMAKGNVTYALVGLGRQPMAASVEITGVEEPPGQPGRATVTVRLNRASVIPGPDEEAVYPQDLVAINLPEAEVAFVVEGDPEAWLPSVLAPVEPIVAESNWIKVFCPAPNTTITPGAPLTGLSNVFEGTVNFRLRLAAEGGASTVSGAGLPGGGAGGTAGGGSGGDAAGGDAATGGASGSEVLSAGYATGAMGDWGRFETTIPFPAEAAGKAAVLEVFWISPKDGSEQDIIRIPVVLGS